MAWVYHYSRVNFNGFGLCRNAKGVLARRIVLNFNGFGLFRNSNKVALNPLPAQHPKGGVGKNIGLPTTPGTLGKKAHELF